MRYFIIAALIFSSISAVTAGKRKQGDDYSSNFSEADPDKKRQKIDIKSLVEEFANTSIVPNNINQILEEFKNHSWSDDEQKDAIAFLDKLIITNNLRPDLKEKAAYILWDIDNVASLTSCCLILHENNDWLIPFLNETICKESAIDNLSSTNKHTSLLLLTNKILIRSNEDKKFSGQKFFYLFNATIILFNNMRNQNILKRLARLSHNQNWASESYFYTLVSLILQGPDTQTPFDCIETLKQVTITNDLIKNVLLLAQNKNWNADHYNHALLALHKVAPNKRLGIIQVINHLSDPNNLYIDPQNWIGDQYSRVITAFNETDKTHSAASSNHQNLPLQFAKWFHFNTNLMLSALKCIKDLDSET